MGDRRLDRHAEWLITKLRRACMVTAPIQPIVTSTHPTRQLLSLTILRLSSTC